MRAATMAARRPKFDLHLPPYILTGKLGEGTYGAVYAATDPRRGAAPHVAIKHMHTHHSFEDDGVPYTTMRELTALKALHHPNIIRPVDIHVTNAGRGDVAVVLPLAQCDLHTWIKTHRKEGTHGTPAHVAAYPKCWEWLNN